MESERFVFHPAKNVPAQGEVIAKKLKQGVTVRCPNDNCGCEFGIPDPPGFVRVEEVQKIMARVQDMQDNIAELNMIIDDMIYTMEGS